MEFAKGTPLGLITSQIDTAPKHVNVRLAALDV